ncbi:MAG: archaemetzincin, partial [Verrucomicrobiales bacterium]
ARYDPTLPGNGTVQVDFSNPVVLRRACKVLSHEMGHMFGARHCAHYHCNLNGSGSLHETDRAPLRLCPVCLRKLHLAIGFDPMKRYEMLEQFYANHELADASKWIKRRVETIRH